MLHTLFSFLFLRRRQALVYVAMAALVLLWGCTSTKSVTFTCQEPQIEIYADGEYLGRNMVSYTLPKGRDYVDVSCCDGGEEVYTRRYHVQGKGGYLIEIEIPKHFRYSDKPY